MLAAGAFDKPQPERMLIPFLKTFWGETYPATEGLKDGLYRPHIRRTVRAR
jgi:hypothetical protein